MSFARKEKTHFWRLEGRFLVPFGAFFGDLKNVSQEKNRDFLGFFWAGTCVFFLEVSGNTVLDKVAFVTELRRHSWRQERSFGR